MSYFIAIPIPEDPINSLQNVLKHLRDFCKKKEIVARYVKIEDFHITVHFLGDLNSEQVSQTVKALNEVQKSNSSFSLTLRYLGAFPEEKHSRALWVGSNHPKELTALHTDLNARLAPLDLPKEDRPFTPHLTLCRFRNPLSTLSLIDQFRRKVFCDFQVSHLVLFKSMGPLSGPTYEVIHKVDLMQRPRAESL